VYFWISLDRVIIYNPWQKGCSRKTNAQRTKSNFVSLKLVEIGNKHGDTSLLVNRSARVGGRYRYYFA
jgi:hypothetical protein